MNRWAKNVLAGLMVWGVIGAAASAQQPQQISPRIGYVYPAGGRQGATFEVIVGGQFLEGVGAAHVSGGGLNVQVLEHTKPLSPKAAGLLRDKAKELQEKKWAAFGGGKRSEPSASQPATRPVWTAEDEKMLADIKKKLSTFVPPNQINPAISETVTLQITIAPDAEPGERELRLQTQFGLTNPRVFCVGTLPEFTKKRAVVLREPKNGLGPKKPPPEPDQMVTLPTVVNGQIMPGGVSRYRFHASQGQRLVFAAQARDLIPYIPDAVPGWFQATLTLYDAKGKELGFADHYLFHPDPVLYCVIPADGDYVIEIRDAIYRGREDFVYRLALGELPFVTGIFPLGGKAGTPTAVEVQGWNLPLTRLTQDNQNREPGIYSFSVGKAGWISTHSLFAVDSWPEGLENETNNAAESAQPIKLPIIVNGRIEQPDDDDVFRFEGRAGEQIIAEVYARRLNSPLDSMLKLTDAAGKQLAYNDDHEDKGSGLNTHHADSLLRATLPASGTYYLHLGDVQHKGGAEYGYRLHVGPPQPDFELRIVPSGINVRPGMSIPLTVYALRKDGFAGEIALSLRDAPEGFTLTGGQVPANQDQVRLTLTVPRTTTKEPVRLNLEGRAMIQKRQVVRPVVPAEDMMQAFAYRHLVPAQELLAFVAGRWMPRGMVKILDATPIKIPAGGTARVRLNAPALAQTDKVQIELSEPPDGLTIKGLAPIREGTEITLQCDAGKVKPGIRGNLIFNIMVERDFGSGNESGPETKRRISLGTLPAIPFEIVAR